MEVPEMKFRLTVDNISTRKEYFSPEVIVRGLPWRISVYKKNCTGEETLSVYLRCENKDKSPGWSCMAYAKYQLISHNQEPYTRNFGTPDEFKAGSTSWGFSKFILMSQLFDPKNNYVNNDSIVIEVKIRANVPQYIDESKMGSLEMLSDESKKCFRLTVKKCSDLIGIFSPVFYFRGLPWRIKVSVNRSDTTKSLSLFLQCEYMDNSTDWSCRVSPIFKLFSKKESMDRTFTHVFNKISTNFGFNSFTSRKNFTDTTKGYIENDEIVLKLEISAEAPNEIINLNGEANVRLVMQCPICFECLVGRQMSSTLCGHLYCKACIEKTIQKYNVCPVCKKHLSISQIHRVYLPS